MSEGGTVKVYISDDEQFDVRFDDAGNVLTVTLRRIVWVAGKDKGGSKLMSERIRRAIEFAKDEWVSTEILNARKDGE